MAYYTVLNNGHELVANDLLFELDLTQGAGHVCCFQKAYDELGESKGRRFLPRAWVRANVRANVEGNEGPAERAFLRWLAGEDNDDQEGLPVEYRELAFEDRVASLLMACLYTSEHVDITAQIPVDKTLKAKNAQKARVDELQERVAKAQRELPGHKIIYTTTPGEKAPRFVSQDHALTLSVTVYKSTLFVAGNYKSFVMGIVPTKMSEEPGYDGFGLRWNQHLERSVAMLRAELGDEHGLKGVIFIGPNPAPKTGDEAHAPHAEMQLVNYLQMKGVPLAGLMFGVTKLCCANCTPELQSRGIAFTNGGGGKKVVNWLHPLKFKTKEVAVFKF